MGKAIGRAVVAVVAGAAVWAVLWLSGTRATQLLLPELVVEGQPLDHGGVLGFYIAYSVGLSVLAGFVTAAVGGTRPMPAVWALAALQLVLGVVAEVAYWDLLPVWYHLVFLALIVPATVYGGRIRGRARGAPVHAPA